MVRTMGMSTMPTSMKDITTARRVAAGTGSITMVRTMDMSTMPTSMKGITTARRAAAGTGSITMVRTMGMSTMTTNAAAAIIMTMRATITQTRCLPAGGKNLRRNLPRRGLKVFCGLWIPVSMVIFCGQKAWFLPRMEHGSTMTMCPRSMMSGQESQRLRGSTVS